MPAHVSSFSEVPAVLVVADHAAQVDALLCAGQLVCPDCQGELRPWGWARRRPVRAADSVRLVRPRRSRCRACDVTHVLLPALMLLRRAYAVTVIGAALLAAARGETHRRIAAALQVPAATVRGWLRRLRARAEDLAAHSVRLAYRLNTPGRLDPTRGSTSPSCTAVAALAAAVAAFERFFEVSGGCRWQVASVLTCGLLLANTSRPYPALL